jgi:hypothetical protein
MTLTQALKENMGDPERKNLLLGSGTERRKKKYPRAHNRKG